MIPKHRKPTHPGEILLGEFLGPMGLSRVLKTTPEFWMNLQDARDLYDAQEHLAHAA